MKPRRSDAGQRRPAPPRSRKGKVHVRSRKRLPARRGGTTSAASIVRQRASRGPPRRSALIRDPNGTSRSPVPLRRRDAGAGALRSVRAGRGEREPHLAEGSRSRCPRAPLGVLCALVRGRGPSSRVTSLLGAGLGPRFNTDRCGQARPPHGLPRRARSRTTQGGHAPFKVGSPQGVPVPSRTASARRRRRVSPRIRSPPRSATIAFSACNDYTRAASAPSGTPRSTRTATPVVSSPAIRAWAKHHPDGALESQQPG